MRTFFELLQDKGVAVIGAGTMGAGIAQKIAQEGIPVFLLDSNLKLAASGKDHVVKTLDEAIARKIFRPEQAAEILDRIEATDDTEKISDVGLVIEAIFEDISAKSQLFEKLNLTCCDHTIFATNTSSLSVAELARASGRADRFGGLHFFFHPAKNRLLEIVAHPGTSRETEEALWDFARAIKKIPIRTSDRSGFAVNRFFVPWLNESVRILEEGEADIATIERAAKDAFKIGMGPFELMNVTGIPIALHAASSLGKAFGRFYEPAGELVRKVEEGGLWPLEGAVDASKIEAVKDRLYGCVFLVATRLVEEEVATPEDTDRGATVGLRWNEGPFQMMNRLSTARSFKLVESFCSRHGQLSPPLTLERMAGKSWPLSYVDVTIRDGIARIALNRPESMNALNPVVTDELKRRFDEAEDNAEVSAIVFEGIGKAFVAGADIGFFLEALDEKDFSRIYRFTKSGQELFSQIADSKKLTLALVDGIAYGGGAELALACQKIVVGQSAQFAFPETGLGICPGLGGTQRLPRKIARHYARHMIFTGQPVSAMEAIAVGLADGYLNEKECKTLDLGSRAKLCVERACDSSTAQQLLPPWAEVAKFLFTDQQTQKTLDGELPEFASQELLASAQNVLKKLAYKAPVALELAARLIDNGARVPLTEGLALELASLKEIFSTEDAYEGLSSLGKRRPVYKSR